MYRNASVPIIYKSVNVREGHRKPGRKSCDLIVLVCMINIKKSRGGLAKGVYNAHKYIFFQSFMMKRASMGGKRCNIIS